jgi:hypothetical protein
VERRERLGERLLHQVLGVLRVAGHAHRRGVELVEEGQRVALEPSGALVVGLVVGGDLVELVQLVVEGVSHRPPA